MAQTDAVFTEVLEIQVDVPKFERSLEELVAAYNRFQDKVENTGLGNAINVGVFARVNEQLTELQQHFQQFDRDMTTQWDEAMSQMTAGMQRMAQTSEVLLRRDAQAAKEAAQARVDGYERSDRAATGFFGKLTSNLGSTAGNMLKHLIIWETYIGLLRLAGELAHLPFKAIEEGIHYLRETQAHQDELTGVLSANVQFSKDFAENLKLSAVASGEVVRALQDVAAKTGLKFSNLFESFKTLTESGGVSAVTSVQELVRLTELFNLAMRASGVSAQTTRRLVSEIPRAMDGTLTPTSKFLEVLHMTRDEWNKIRDLGMEHHDLLQRLEPRLKPYLDAVSQAQLHQAVLVEQVELLRKRFEALVAEPVFNTITETALKIVNYFKEHQKDVEDFGRTLADVVQHLINIGKEMLELGGGPIRMVANVTKGFLALESVVDNIVTGLRQIVAVAQHMEFNKGSLLTLTPLSDGKTLQELNAIQLAFDRREQARTALGFELNDAIAGRRVHRETPTGLAGFDSLPEGVKAFFDQNGGILNAPISPQPDSGHKKEFDEKAARNSLAEISREAQLELAQVNKYSDAVVNLFKENVANQFATVIESEKNIVDHLTGIKAVIDAVFAEAEDKAQAIGGKNVDKTVETLEGQRLNAVRRVENEIASHQRTIAQQTVREKQAEITQKVQLETELSRKQIELAKETGATQEAIARQTADIEEKLLRAKIDSLREEQTLFVEGSQQRKAVDAQLANAIEIEGLQKVIDARRIANAQVEDSIRATRMQTQAALEQLRANEQLVQINERAGVSATILVKANKELHQQYLAIIDAAIRNIQNQLREAEATGKHADAVLRLRRELGQLRNERNSAELQNIANRPVAGPISDRNRQGDLLKKEQEQAQQRLQDAVRNLAQAIINGNPHLKEYFEEVNQAQASLAIANQNLDQFNNKLAFIGGQALDAVFGPGFKAAWDAANTNVEKFGVIADRAGQALGNIQQIVGGFQSAFKQGGTIGAIGHGMQFAAQFDPEPISRGILQIGGAIFGAIGSFFTAQARHIAEEIKKQFNQTMRDYQNGNADLIDTINHVEQERADAIRRLSGKKGGKDLLNELLPQFDDALAQLRKAQKSILDNMDKQLQVLRLQSSELGGFVQKWTDLNKTVEEYIKAGGDAAKAQEFLSRSLEQIREDAEEGFLEGERQAIQDAIALNDLIQQRIDLKKEEAEAEFAILSRDAIERRASGALIAANDLRKLREQYQKNLDNLNSQIDLETQKVNKEQQLFGFAQDILSLHKLDAELQLAAIDKQIKKWTDLKAIMDGIVQDSSGVFGLTGGFSQQIGAVSITVPITIIGAGDVDPQKLGGDIATIIDRELRFGK